MRKTRSLIFVGLGVAMLCSMARAQQDAPITLDVDATEAPRRLLHARLTLPAKPGPLTLCYPKWIPGEHGPTGPVVNQSGLKLSAGGKPVAWQRDSVDMYAFHGIVPESADSLNVELDFLAPTETEGFTGGASTTPNLAIISWNTLLLYPHDDNRKLFAGLLEHEFVHFRMSDILKPLATGTGSAR